MNLVTQSIVNLYKQHAHSSKLTVDSQQNEVIQQLQYFLDQLSQPEPTIIQQLRFKFRKRTPYTQGVYLWGPVGRGKTMLMDLFCECLHPEKHLRLHFHHFMEMTHQQLFANSGEPDPLSCIADKLSHQYKVICFDEFFVSDIGDAMLLGRLYKYLFRNGTFIVSTSNTKPSNLYHDGLHRDRFTPAITLINQKMKTIDLCDGLDHRQRKLTRQHAYYIKDEAALYSIFQQIAFPNHKHVASHHLKSSPSNTRSVTLCNRTINCKAHTPTAIWFEFSELCEGPRSSRDYIDLASRNKHIILSHVPQFTGKAKEQIKARGTEDGGGNLNSTGLRKVTQNNTDDSARRFISLVDELYDNRINLFISAECSMEELYKGELLSSPFKRTLSRLHEMSSAEYQQLQLKALNEHEDCYASQPQTLS
jgi:cell division protein ZapE